MGTMLSACGCRCDTDDPPPCDPQDISFVVPRACGYGTVPVRYTVTDPFGVVVFDDIVPGGAPFSIPAAHLGNYSWTAELIGITTFDLAPASGVVTVRCKSGVANPFGISPVLIWAGTARQRDVVCPICMPDFCHTGIRVDSPKTLTWYGGTVTLTPYPAVAGVPWVLDLPGPFGPGAVRESNCWAGLQRYDGACCVVPDEVFTTPGQGSYQCPRPGSVDLLWVVQLNDGRQCRIDCLAMMASLQPGPYYNNSWPTTTGIDQAGTSIPALFGYRLHRGLGLVGQWAWNPGDPDLSCDPLFVQFTGHSLTVDATIGVDPRIFGYSSSGYGYGPPQCVAYPPFPVTVTD